MRNFVTLFDHRYLTRGLALYESLVRHSSVPFTLFVLAMDKECGSALRAMNLPGVKVIDLSSFEACDLTISTQRETRTWQEFCWGCASQFSWFLMATEELDEITYCDADLFFFSDPEQIFSEIDSRSIGIIPHRFEGPKIATNGKFNVSFVHFRGEIGQRCLSRWAEQCREWCYYRVEPGRFADQKYLDEWEGLYGDEVCVIQNPGAGLAPWNLANYQISGAGIGGPVLVGDESRKPYKYNWLTFYHFHEYKDADHLTNYKLRPEDKALIYQPYIEALEQAKASIEAIGVRQ